MAQLNESIQNFLATIQEKANTLAWPALVGLFLWLYHDEIKFRLRHSNFEYGEFKMTGGPYQAVTDFELEWTRFMSEHGDTATAAQLRQFINTARQEFVLSKEQVNLNRTASAAEVNKAQKELRSAESFELEGFNAILDRNHGKALKAFDNAYERAPTYHNVDEIRRLLKTSEVINETVMNTILTNYAWGMPASVRQQMKVQITK
jgi:hypothetical protein